MIEVIDRVYKCHFIMNTTSTSIRGGTNTKIPNTEHFEHWHTELRTFRTWTWDFETELRTCETEHRTFIRQGGAWGFGGTQKFHAKSLRNIDFSRKFCKKNFFSKFLYFFSIFCAERWVSLLAQMFGKFAEH